MKTYTLFFCAALACGVCHAHAQQAAGDNGKKRLALSVWVSDNINELTPEAQNNLQNKLTQIASKQGIAATPGQSRFVLTANVVVQEKYITSTAPPKHACKLDVTLYVGDGFEGKVFASYTSSVAGIGDNEAKAYMSALKNIKVLDPAYKKLMDLGADKIVGYFNAQCDVVIKEAQTLAATQKYEEALWKLTSVPDICTDCRKRAIDEAGAVFQQKIDRECKLIYSEANNIWSAGQNVEAAEKAGAVLAAIDPSSNCFGEAMALSGKIAQRITQRIKELDDRVEAEKKEALAFQRAMEEKSRQLEQVRMEKNAQAEQERVKAYRDVSIAWAKNQPKVAYVPFW
ncbi:MAG: hypothetical protein LBF55_02045 [Prevotellaceae bacterium]|jgi:hypothetical protein|nr:hypothetical protein [Prevotellaceae bacterium]